MHDLVAITPLGAAEPRVDTHGPVTLSEITDTALASVAARLGQEEQARAWLGTTLGVAAPDPARVGGKDLTAFWMGPDQWMVEAPYQTHEMLASDLARQAGGVASVTEQSDAWCRFDLAGDGLADVFERLCPADIRSFKGGEAVRTSIDHLGCFLICRTPEHFSVYGPRSSAGSLHHALLVAMRSAH
ncbi:MAG: sarcosine oxidase subunit gamma [Ruegeria sp.]